MANFAPFKKRMSVNRGIRLYQLSNSGELCPKTMGIEGDGNAKNRTQIRLIYTDFPCRIFIMSILLILSKNA